MSKEKDIVKEFDEFAAKMRKHIVEDETDSLLIFAIHVSADDDDDEKLTVGETRSWLGVQYPMLGVHLAAGMTAATSEFLNEMACAEQELKDDIVETIAPEFMNMLKHVYEEYKAQHGELAEDIDIDNIRIVSSGNGTWN